MWTPSSLPPSPGRSAGPSRTPQRWRAIAALCALAGMTLSPSSTSADDRDGHEAAGPSVGTSSTPLDVGQPAPFAGELVRAAAMAAVVAAFDDLERRSEAERTACDDSLRLADGRRVRETTALTEEMGRQHQVALALLRLTQAKPSFWRTPEFALGAGVVIGGVVTGVVRSHCSMESHLEG